MLLSSKLGKLLEKTKEGKIAWANDYSKDSYRGHFQNSNYYVLIEMIPLVSQELSPDNSFFIKLMKMTDGSATVTVAERVTIQMVSPLLKEIRQNILTHDISDNIQKFSSDLDSI